MTNAECGVRNAESRGLGATPAPASPYSARRTPHSAFTWGQDGKEG